MNRRSLVRSRKQKCYTFTDQSVGCVFRCKITTVADAIEEGGARPSSPESLLESPVASECSHGKCRLGGWSPLGTPPYELTLRLSVDSHCVEAPSKALSRWPPAACRWALPPLGLHTGVGTRKPGGALWFVSPALSPVQEGAWWGAGGGGGLGEGHSNCPNLLQAVLEQGNQTP